MSTAKKVLITICCFYVLALGSGFLLPKETVVSRQIQLTAEQNAVFSLVGEHKRFLLWSPWAAYDPSMKVFYEGPEIGVGAKQLWQSSHPKVGNGQAVYTAYEMPKHVSMDLNFDQSQGISSFDLSSPSPGLTEVVWTYKSQHSNIFERFIGYFLLEGVLAPDFESGLNSLKKLAENPSSRASEKH